MEESMQVSSSQERGKLWPVVFSLLGILNLIQFFYQAKFQTTDLLQGIGFLLMAPLPYLYPSSYSFNPNTLRVRPAAWTKWLSGVGLALVAAGFAVQWL